MNEDDRDESSSSGHGCEKSQGSTNDDDGSMSCRADCRSEGASCTCRQRR